MCMGSCVTPSPPASTHTQAEAITMRTQSDIKKLPECGRSRRGRAGGALIYTVAFTRRAASREGIDRLAAPPRPPLTHSRRGRQPVQANPKP